MQLQLDASDRIVPNYHRQTDMCNQSEEKMVRAMELSLFGLTMLELATRS